MMTTLLLVVCLGVVCGLLYAILGRLVDLLESTRKAEHWLEAIDKREAEENSQRAQRMVEFLAAKGSGRELLKQRLARRLAEREVPS